MSGAKSILQPGQTKRVTVLILKLTAEEYYISQHARKQFRVGIFNNVSV
jgi:hypothetical protein